MANVSRLILAAPLLAIASLPSEGHAQCPDGSPPPCVRQAARPVAPTVPVAAERARRFLILPFRNVTRRAEQDWLVEGSTTMISDALSRWQGITVVPDERLYPALRKLSVVPGALVDAQVARRLAEETGGWTAVTGEVIASGPRIRVSARAWDIPTQRELVRASADVPADGDVRVAFDSIGIRLLRAAGVESVSSDLTGATTRDIDAYRAYLRGLARMRRADVKDAHADFSEAVRRDSGFALAWVRLAEATLGLEPVSILNPMSNAARYAARAVALSAKLPPRQRDLIQATEAGYRAQFDDTRRLLEGLLAKDSNDVDVLAAMGGLENFDPILVNTGGVLRPRGNPNRAARYTKRATELDPSRQNLFAVLASIYAAAGVPGSSPAIGVTRAPTSFPDLISMFQTREHVRVYLPLLVADTLQLVPIESIPAIPRDSLANMRRRARAIARSWGERWVSVAAREAAPHVIMAELYQYDGQYREALREVQLADSIGVQSPSWSPAARRMIYLGKMGDHAAAGGIADSLTEAGFFNRPNIVATNGDAVAWAFNLAMLRGRPAMARTILEQSIVARRVVTPALPDFSGFNLAMGNDDPDEEPGIPREVRRLQLDTLAAHALHFASDSLLGRWLPVMLPSIVIVADTTRKRAEELLGIADRLATGGFESLAYQLAANAVGVDSLLEVQAASRPWYRTAGEALTTARRAMQSRFEPASVHLDSTRATFEWRVDDTRPFPRDQAITPAGRGEYRWEVSVDAGDRYFRVIAVGPRKSATATPGTASLGELLGAVNRVVQTGRLENGVRRDTTQLQVPPRVEASPGTLRMIVTDPVVVQAILRARPPHARFQFLPCARPVGTLSREECVDREVAIRYP